MIIAPSRASDLAAESRLDVRYFASPAVIIRHLLANAPDVELRSLGGVSGYAKVTMPGRLKQAAAVPGEEGIPYLRPYDVFEYFPPEVSRLSISRTENIDDYRITEGQLLQTRSGRNLGPLTIADKYLARFALSDDMIRIEIDDPDDRYYTLSFLQSPTGQHLLRGDLGGSVIDHISTDQVSALQVPFFHSLQRRVIDLARSSTQHRESARTGLYSALEALNHAVRAFNSTQPLRDGWTVRASALGSRLDAAVHSTRVQAARKMLLEMGGVRLADVADVRKPGGRYKTYYVEPEHGTPLLSGRQLLQEQTVNRRSISSRSVSPDSGYEVEEGWVCFQADGRAEEGLGFPAVITSERAGWYTSGHVGRAIPNNAKDSGWLWLALACEAVQVQLSSLACGSVVDALYPEDLEEIILPPRSMVDADAANRAWRSFATAHVLGSEASGLIEGAVQGLGV